LPPLVLLLTFPAPYETGVQVCIERPPLSSGCRKRSKNDASCAGMQAAFVTRSRPLSGPGVTSFRALIQGRVQLLYVVPETVSTRRL
jgi:hypothetical protein